jgi:hypothetical protein
VFCGVFVGASVCDGIPYSVFTQKHTVAFTPPGRLVLLLQCP